MEITMATDHWPFIEKPFFLYCIFLLIIVVPQPLKFTTLTKFKKKSFKKAKFLFFKNFNFNFYFRSLQKICRKYFFVVSEKTGRMQMRSYGSFAEFEKAEMAKVCPWQRRFLFLKKNIKRNRLFRVTFVFSYEISPLSHLRSNWPWRWHFSKSFSLSRRTGHFIFRTTTAPRHLFLLYLKRSPAEIFSSDWIRGKKK